MPAAKSSPRSTGNQPSQYSATRRGTHLDWAPISTGGPPACAGLGPHHIGSLGIFDPSTAPGGRITFEQMVDYYAGRIHLGKTPAKA